MIKIQINQYQMINNKNKIIKITKINKNKLNLKNNTQEKEIKQKLKQLRIFHHRYL